MKNLIDNANALIKQVQAINPEHALGAGFAANLRECAEALQNSMRSYARATAGGDKVVGKALLQVGTSAPSFDAIVEFITQCVNDGKLCPDIAHSLLEKLQLTVVTPVVAPDANVERNRQELLDRSRVGLQKYGVTTERNDLGLREWAQHAIEEALDLANYLQAFKENLALLDDVQGEPVAYLRIDQLNHVKRMGPILGEIADSPRVDRVPVYAATCCDHNSKK